MNSPLSIKANHLKKSFKKVDVLLDVSFEVSKGSIFALLGSNGAGKTTTINILTTLLQPDSGTAEVSGFDVIHQPDQVRRHISLTGQFAAIDEVLTARENLILIGRLRHIKDPTHIAEALLRQFDLTDAKDRRAGTFSGGMRRRLDIAMSLIGTPSIIFLDEPTNGLDPRSRNIMWETIKNLAKNGTTVFLTTQYLEEADQLADTIAVLSHGRIAAQGTPDELKKLVPHGQVELRFHNVSQLHAAQKALSGFPTLPSEADLLLAITTDGSVTELARVFTQIQHAHLEVTEFAQKTPTLDDAFFKLTNQEKH